MWDGGDVLDAANFNAGPGEGAHCGLGPRAGHFCADAAGGLQVDVQGGDAALPAAGDNIGRGEHCGVGGGLLPVRLHFHPTGHLCNCLPVGHVRHVHKRVVGGGVNVRHTKHSSAFGHIGT